MAEFQIQTSKMLSYSLKNIFVIVALVLVASSPLIASQNSQDSTKKETYNPVPAIMHHISDSHEWHFWGEGDNSRLHDAFHLLVVEGLSNENKQELIKDLKERTGLPIHEVKVDKIDFLKDTAAVTIYYNRD